MANAGLQVYAQDGSNAFQIDSTYKNYFLRYKTQVTLNSKILFTNGSTSCGEATFSVNCKGAPIIVIANPNPSVSISAADSLIQPPSSGYGTAGTYNVFLVGGINSVVDVYVYDNLSPPDAGTYGLQVYTAAGELAFDSSWKALRVIAVITGSQSGSPGAVAIPSGKKYGVMCNGGYYSKLVNANPAVYGYFALVGAITTTGFATIGVVQTGQTSGSVINRNDAVTAFVVDVTGH